MRCRVQIVGTRKGRINFAYAKVLYEGIVNSLQDTPLVCAATDEYMYYTRNL